MPAIFLLEALGDHLWGFKPNLMADFVHHQGALPALFWFAKNMPPYERILEEWGPISTHLIATVLSTLNGCEYCAHGHAYALELHYLQAHDKLFPLSKVEMFELHRLPEEQILERFEEALAEADLFEEILPLKRVAELRQNKSLVTTASDNDLLHLIQMFLTLSTCAIASNTPLDSAHDPIGRDRALCDRYTTLRRAQPSANASPTPVSPTPVSLTPVSPTPVSPTPLTEPPVVLTPADLYQDAYQDIYRYDKSP
jgi:hypothetical protein